MEQEQKKSISFKKYLYAFLVIAASIVIFLIFMYMGQIIKTFHSVVSVLSPIVWGLVMAYVLNPVMKLFEKIFIKPFTKIIKKENVCFKVNRAVSLFLTMSLFLALIVFLGYMVIPELYKSVSNLVVTLPGEISSLSEKIIALAKDYMGIDNLVKTATDFLSNWINTDLAATVNRWAPMVASGVMNAFGFIADFFIGFVVCIYFLYRKEHFIGAAKKVVCAVFKKDTTVNTIFEKARHSHEAFGGFISGKLLDSFIVGVLTFIVMLILDIPYPLLIGVVIAITDIIPVFGPFIGAIPSALLILLVDPIKAIIFVVVIIVIQQIDGNILAPKIIGETTGLSSFWTIFAITVGGGFFGIVGMIVGVPAFVVIYDIASELVNSALKKKNLPTETDFYEDVNYIKDGVPVEKID